MLGTGTIVGGVAAVAPSQVWPFRKIFLPSFSMPKPWIEVSKAELDATMKQFFGMLPDYLSGTYPALYSGPLKEGCIYHDLIDLGWDG